jgi:hypothetical protein
MVIYEVTAKVGSHLADEFERFMTEQHIPDVLRTGAFTSASFLLGSDGLYQARYTAQDRDALETYFNESSAQLRKEMLDRFPQGVELTRQEWNLIKTWKC